MDAFEKILAALKLSLADVALINIAGPQGPTVDQLLEYFRPLKMVLLGTQISVEENQNTRPKSTPQILHSYSFAEMMDDVAKKRTFWAQLKALLE